MESTKGAVTIDQQMISGEKMHQLITLWLALWLLIYVDYAYNL